MNKKTILTILLATPLFITVLAIENFQPAFAGQNSFACFSPQTLEALLADPANCIIVDDKTFTNFRNFNGNFDPAQIQVTGVTVGNEKGLQFSSQILSVTGTLNNPSGIGISFDYDVISSGDPISDNTLTLDIFTAEDSLEILGTRGTNVVVEERVHSDVAQQNQIAFKDVSADASFGPTDLSEHVDYPSLHQMVSVNVDVGLITDTNCGTICFASIQQFTQTFSQSPRLTTLIGGALLSIDSISLLVTGIQSSTWMIPVVLSVLGIGLFVVSRKSELR